MMKKSGVSLVVSLFLIAFSLSMVIAPTEEDYTLSGCGDYEDNDGDGLTDYPDDTDCTSISDREQECLVDAACGRYKCSDTGDCYVFCTDSTQCRDDIDSDEDGTADVVLVCEESVCVPEDDSNEVDVCENSACGEYICDTNANDCYDACTSSDAECAGGYVCDTDSSTCVAACDESTCGGYACTYNGEECETDCGSDGNCADGFYCISDGTCVEDADIDGNPDSCLENVDCASGYVCDFDVCVAYCDIGEAACSDGEDNDGDGNYDYDGACTLNDGSVVSCQDTIFSSLGGDDTCESYCDSQQLGYLEADSDCVSPLDTSEASDGPTYGAPEEEKGFWASVWDFLVFWN